MKLWKAALLLLATVALTMRAEDEFDEGKIQAGQFSVYYILYILYFGSIFFYIASFIIFDEWNL